MASSTAGLKRSRPSKDDLRESPTSKKQRLALAKAQSKQDLDKYLSNASEEKLRKLFKLVLSKSEDAERVAQEVVKDSIGRAKYHESQLRKDGRWKFCFACRKPYDTQGADLVCEERHHPGKLKPDYHHSHWDDFDPECHGPYEEYEEENPEAFLYTCCDQPGDSEGCVDELYHFYFEDTSP